MLFKVIFDFNYHFVSFQDTLAKFKKNINNLFPTIMDTKYISYEFQRKLKKEGRGFSI